MKSEVDPNGVDRCRTEKQVAVQNVPGDDAKGFHYEKAFCNRPMTLSISQNRKICPECYREPVVGFPEPRVTNAAGISLTQKELEECGVKDGVDPSSLKAAAPKKVVSAPAIVLAAPGKVVRKDEVSLAVPLNDLESNADVAAYLIKKVLEGFGSLPVTNYSESKRLMKLEEKLEALLRS